MATSGPPTKRRRVEAEEEGDILRWLPPQVRGYIQTWLTIPELLKWLAAFPLDFYQTDVMWVKRAPLAWSMWQYNRPTSLSGVASRDELRCQNLMDLRLSVWGPTTSKNLCHSCGGTYPIESFQWRGRVRPFLCCADCSWDRVHDHLSVLLRYNLRPSELSAQLPLYIDSDSEQNRTTYVWVSWHAERRLGKK